MIAQVLLLSGSTFKVLIGQLLEQFRNWSVRWGEGLSNDAKMRDPQLPTVKWRSTIASPQVDNSMEVPGSDGLVIINLRQVDLPKGIQLVSWTPTQTSDRDLSDDVIWGWDGNNAGRIFFKYVSMILSSPSCLVWMLETEALRLLFEYDDQYQQ